MILFMLAVLLTGQADDEWCKPYCPEQVPGVNFRSKPMYGTHKVITGFDTDIYHAIWLTQDGEVCGELQARVSGKGSVYTYLPYPPWPSWAGTAEFSTLTAATDYIEGWCEP